MDPGSASTYQALATMWTITSLINSNIKHQQLCDGRYVFGGPGMVNGPGYLERIYTNLVAHNTLKVVFYLYIYGSWR